MSTLSTGVPVDWTMAISAATDASDDTVDETFAVACNLAPTAVGDVDLGSKTGLPIVAQDVGETIDVSVRVNTGGATVGAYDVFIEEAGRSPVRSYGPGETFGDTGLVTTALLPSSVLCREARCARDVTEM